MPSALHFERHRAPELEAEATAARRDDLELGTAFGETLLQQDESALEVRAERRQPETLIEPELTIGELAAPGIDRRFEELPEDAAGDVANEVVAVDEHAVVIGIEYEVT